VRLHDLDTGNILFRSENQGAFRQLHEALQVVRVGIDVWDLDEAGTATEVLSHTCDAREREVLIQLPVGTIGDTLGWFAYVARFAAVHGARVACRGPARPGCNACSTLIPTSAAAARGSPPLILTMTRAATGYGTSRASAMRWRLLPCRHN
jgi:hypothetical protein